MSIVKREQLQTNIEKKKKKSFQQAPVLLEWIQAAIVSCRSLKYQYGIHTKRSDEWHRGPSSMPVG